MLFRSVAFLLVLAFCALAQPAAKYPSQIIGWQDLLRAKNQATTELKASISSTSTSIQVANGSIFEAPIAVTIDSEHIKICSITGNTLNVCPGGRGFDGSIATSHNAGSLVASRILAHHHEQMAAEMIAVQQALGGASNLVHQNALVRIATSGALAEALNLVWDGATLFIGPQAPGVYGNFVGITSLPSGTDALRIHGRMGANDYWQIRGSDIGVDNSALELVTGDNYNEPFRFKQIYMEEIPQIVSRFGEGPKGQFASIGRDADPNATLNIQDARQGVIGQVTFSGTGLNDLTTSGSYYRTIQQTYCVQIDGVGTPNTFKWSEDNCSTFVASGVQITGSEQLLSWGVNITFASTTGHTFGDRWTFVAEPAGETLLRITSGQGNLYYDSTGFYVSSPVFQVVTNDSPQFTILSDSSVHMGQNGFNIFSQDGKRRASGSANFYTTNTTGFIVDSASIFGWSDTEGQNATYDSNITVLKRESAGVISLARKSGLNPETQYFYFDGPNLKISFGGTTPSFPSLKRSSAALQARLADDSGFARFQAASPAESNDVLVYGSASPPAAGCAQFDSSGKIVSTGVSCGTGTVNAYASVTDGSTTASASGSDTLKFRSSDSSVLITVGSNDPVHGDNVDIRLPKTADASTFTSSTTWSRPGSAHGLGTSCDWTWTVYTVSGSTYTHTEGFDGYTCNTTTGDVTITWPVATAGRLVLVKSGGSDGSGGGGLPDPGSNGMIARTALNTTAARTITGTANRIVVTNGDGVSGNPTIDVGSNIADRTQSGTWSAGAKQTFQASASTAGARIVCAALPSSPAAGDIACDSNDGNKLKQYNGSSWFDLTATGTGHTIQDEGNPLPSRAALNFTGAGVTCTDDSANNRTTCSIPGGGSGSFDPSGTYDMTGNNKVNVSYISHYLNNNSTGTVLYQLVCLASDGTVQSCTTANASRRLGICQEGCGTTGAARIAILGRMTCQFDGSVTAGNWAGPSSTANGKCTDAGTTKPAGALGIILVTQSGAGNYDILAGLP